MIATSTLTTSTLAGTVAANLRDYLHDRLGVSDLGYAEEPSPITDGWETYIYRFQLQKRAGLPRDFAGPLILRVYSSMNGLPRLRHEFAAQRHMHALGYPVAKPLLIEEDANRFGGPFMIMELVPGRTFLDFLLHHPWRIVDGPALIAELHARLHRLPADGFPAPPEPFLTRRLEEMRAAVKEYHLKGLSSGLDWLYRHRPAPPPRPRIIHLDFHPVNMMFHEGRFTGVLDWCESDVGDPHADVAATLVLLKSAPVEVSTLFQRVLTWPGRFLLWRWYLRTYRWRLPLDKERLAYFVAWAALRRLCCWGRWLRAGPRITGSKPSSMRYLSVDRVDILRQCFHRWSGVGVKL